LVIIVNTIFKIFSFSGEFESSTMELIKIIQLFIEAVAFAIILKIRGIID
jgi:hypothetical protein